MPCSTSREFREQFAKAKDLKMIITYEKDESAEGEIRIKQAQKILSQMILLGKKKGRPKKREEVLSEVA